MIRSGTFDHPIIDDQTGRCTGVVVKDGTKYLADRVIMATGAWTPSLIHLEDQCVSKVSGWCRQGKGGGQAYFGVKEGEREMGRLIVRCLEGEQCWIVAHLELTDEEAGRYKGIPVVYNEEVVSPQGHSYDHKRSHCRPSPTPHPLQGFCFEPRLVPDPRTGKSRWIIKLCDEFPGYTRYLPIRPFGTSPTEEMVNVSVPRSHSDHPTDEVPDEGRERLRRVVQMMLPEFERREFVKTYCCWCTGEYGGTPG